MAKASPNEPLGRDRLFARSILEERPRSLFGENLEAVCELSREERWERFLHCVEEADHNDDEHRLGLSTRDVFVEVLSDIEAWLVVEVARKASQSRFSKSNGDDA